MKWWKVEIMLLTGTFFRTLGDKHRLSIPKPMRDALGYPSSSVFYLAPGTDGSLALYSEAGFSRLADQLSQSPPTGQDVRAFSRLFYSQAQRVEIDRQGRLRIPIELARLATLDKEVVLIGVSDHVEVWDRAEWHAYLEEKQPRYDEIAESAFQRGSIVNASALNERTIAGGVETVERLSQPR